MVPSSQKSWRPLVADEMGLGKTLTALCLVWVLLRRGPGGSPAGNAPLFIRTRSVCVTSLGVAFRRLQAECSRFSVGEEGGGRHTILSGRQLGQGGGQGQGHPALDAALAATAP